MGVNVGQVLRQAALRWPDRRGLVDLGHAGAARRELSFAELDERARTIAAVLQSRGLATGASVALIGENSAEFVAAWFGVVYAGCAVVPIPILTSAQELRFRVEHAQCRALLFDRARAELARDALSGVEPAPVCLALEGLAESAARALRYPADTAPSDLALILYTSGTTGKSKGAAITHASLALHTAALAHHALRLSSDDSVLGVLPLTHSYGCRMVMLAAFFAGARCWLVPRFDAARTLALLREEPISFLPAVPTMYAAWGAEPEGLPPRALRLCLAAGAPLADETARRAERRLSCEVRQGYGMTEATFSTVNAPPDARVLGSVGKPVWGVEVRVVDAAGNDVPVGQDGEVVVRGQNVMSHYLHDPEATLEVATGGFIRSGDVGRFDEHGRLAIVDRIKDMIIRGGYNVYPSEVEEALTAHPDVVDVAVVGKPDDYYGEEVVAVVVARAGAARDADALIAFAEARVGRVKRPRELVFVEALPLGPSGKVQKRVLRDWLRAGRSADP